MGIFDDEAVFDSLSPEHEDALDQQLDEQEDGQNQETASQEGPAEGEEGQPEGPTSTEVQPKARPRPRDNLRPKNRTRWQSSHQTLP